MRGPSTLLRGEGEGGREDGRNEGTGDGRGEGTGNGRSEGAGHRSSEGAGHRGCDPLEPKKNMRGRGVAMGGVRGLAMGGTRRINPGREKARGALPLGRRALSHPPVSLLFFLKGVAAESGFHRNTEIARGMNPAIPSHSRRWGREPSRGTVTSWGLGMPGEKPPNQHTGLPSEAITCLQGTPTLVAPHGGLSA